MKETRKSTTITVTYEKGLHVRVAAMIVQKAGMLQKKYGVKYKIKVGDFNEVPLTSILLVTALKIKQDDCFELITIGDLVDQASGDMKAYLEGDFSVAEEQLGEVDRLLQANMITVDKIFNAVENGLIVVNENMTVVIFNKVAEHIFGMTTTHALGKHVNDIYKWQQVKDIVADKEQVPTFLQTINDRKYMVSVSRLVDLGDAKGAIIVFEDISKLMHVTWELDEIMELQEKTAYLEEELSRRQKLDPAFARIVGVSSTLYDVMKIAGKTSNNNMNVLIRGESGTGKELFAEAIHYASKRKDAPFVCVNCAAIPANLLESEMFGHIKGAYTGAVRNKMGKFELAHGGTIFLDEIGELDLDMQAKMLRVIQKKEFQRVGDERTTVADVRIVAATNRDLEKCVEEGTFREDLYYRLNVIPLWLPPLRERLEDIPMLVEHFLRKVSEDTELPPKTMSKLAMSYLLSYKWPGNIRELENIIERLFVLSDEEEIGLGDLPQYILDNVAAMPVSERSNPLVSEGSEESLLTWDAYEAEIIEKAMRIYGSFNAAGKALGISHKTVAAKARKYNISD